MKRFCQRGEEEMRYSEALIKEQAEVLSRHSGLPKMLVAGNGAASRFMMRARHACRVGDDDQGAASLINALLEYADTESGLRARFERYKE